MVHNNSNINTIKIEHVVKNKSKSIITSSQRHKRCINVMFPLCIIHHLH